MGDAVPPGDLSALPLPVALAASAAVAAGAYAIVDPVRPPLEGGALLARVRLFHVRGPWAAVAAVALVNAGFRWVAPARATGEGRTRRADLGGCMGVEGERCEPGHWCFIEGRGRL